MFRKNNWIILSVNRILSLEHDYKFNRGQDRRRIKLGGKVTLFAVEVAEGSFGLDVRVEAKWMKFNSVDH